MNGRQHRRAMRICILGASLIAALIAAAPQASSNTVVEVVLVQPPAAISSGATAQFTVRLQGATAVDIERGVAWTAAKPLLFVDGWEAASYDDLGRTKLARNLGDTAVFEFTAEAQGRFRLEVAARRTAAGSESVQAAPLVLYVDVTSPDVYTHCPPRRRTCASKHRPWPTRSRGPWPSTRRAWQPTATSQYRSGVMEATGG